MIRSLAVGLAILASMAGSASAASVGFTGVFNQNIIGAGSGFLGDVSVATGTPVSFGDVVGGPNFSPMSIDASGIVGGGPLLLGSGGPLYVLSGTSTWSDSGMSDNVQFDLSVATVDGGPANGSLAIAFTGDLISGGSVYSEANLDELLNGAAYLSQTGSITYVDTSTGSLVIYGGTVAAVPEPSALGAILGLGVMGMIRRRRR